MEKIQESFKECLFKIKNKELSDFDRFKALEKLLRIYSTDSGHQIEFNSIRNAFLFLFRENHFNGITENLKGHKFTCFRIMEEITKEDLLNMHFDDKLIEDFYALKEKLSSEQDLLVNIESDTESAGYNRICARGCGDGLYELK